MHEADWKPVPRNPGWEAPLAPSPLLPPPWQPVRQQAHLFDYLLVIRKHLLLSLSFLLTLVTVVTIATFRMKPVYVATARVAIDRETSGLLPFQNSSSGDYWYDLDSYIETQAKVLQSDTLALETIKSLELWNTPEFRSDPRELAALDAGSSSDPQPVPRPAILNNFLGRLGVRRLPNSQLLEVSFESHDPQLAAAVVNRHLQNFIEMNYRTRYEAAKRASDWLERQLADMKARVEQSEDARLAYERQNQIWAVSETQDITTQKLSELNRELTEAQAARMKAEAGYVMVREGRLDALPAVQENPVIQDLTRHLNELRGEYADAVNRYGPAYPKVVRLKAQIEAAEKALATQKQTIAREVETEYRAALQREQLLQQALDRQKQLASEEAQKLVQYNILKREAETNKQLYVSLLEKLKEAGLSAGLRSNNIRIVDPAMVPSAPARPQRARDITLALMVGLVGGIGLAFFREYLDNTVKTPDDIELLTSLPALAIVPTMGALGYGGPRRRMLPGGRSAEAATGKAALVSHEQPQSQMAEAFRALRTSLLLSRADQPPQIILVTSALPKEGKTTAAVNLAITLAQLGDRTLLIDADLRKPGIARLLGLNDGAGSGLSTYLAGAAELESCLLPCPSVPELNVLPAGPVPPNPADLLSSQRLTVALEWLRERFKFIVIDSPPIMAATDAVILSPWADGVVLVARSGETPKNAFARAQELLANVKCRLLGVVLNAVNTTSPDYYYSYRYYPYYGDYGASAGSAEPKS
jgi:capsular exopolysaccharide synthesis family protein